MLRVEEDRVCVVVSTLISMGNVGIRKEMWIHTITDTARADLLQYFGPDGCVAFLVRGELGGLEVDVLADALGLSWSGAG